MQIVTLLIHKTSDYRRNNNNIHFFIVNNKFKNFYRFDKTIINDTDYCLVSKLMSISTFSLGEPFARMTRCRRAFLTQNKLSKNRRAIEIRQ